MPEPEMIMSHNDPAVEHGPDSPVPPTITSPCAMVLQYFQRVACLVLRQLPRDFFTEMAEHALKTSSRRTARAQRQLQARGSFFGQAAFPCLQLFLRQGIMETVVNDYAVLHGTKLPPAHGIVGDEASDRLASPGNDDFLASLHVRQQT